MERGMSEMHRAVVLVFRVVVSPDGRVLVE